MGCRRWEKRDPGTREDDERRTERVWKMSDARRRGSGCGRASCRYDEGGRKEGTGEGTEREKHGAEWGCRRNRTRRHLPEVKGTGRENDDVD